MVDLRRIFPRRIAMGRSAYGTSATALPIRAKSAIELIPDIDSMLPEAKRIERNLGTLERESAFSSASGAKRSDNGPDALRILGNQPENCDPLHGCAMPGLSGTELTKVARETRPDLNVVLSSAYIEGDAPAPT